MGREVFHPVDVHVGNAVRKVRVERDCSQSDLARALGLTFQQIQKYEKGSNRISASKLFEIAQFFRVEISVFFDGIDKTSEIVTNNSVTLNRGSIRLVRAMEALPAHAQSAIIRMVEALTRTSAPEAEVHEADA